MFLNPWNRKGGEEGRRGMEEWKEGEVWMSGMKERDG
jgi:hypothetical protein